MPCPVCHKEVTPGSAFCPHCGAPTPASATTGPAFTETFTPPPNYAPPPPNYPPQPLSAAGLSDNAAAAIAYITFIPAIIFLVLEPYNRIPLVRFHAWQSIGFSVAAFLLHIVISILAVALHFIPGVFFIFSLIHSLVSLALFLVWLFVILKASRGEWYKLPVIGDFAMKQSQG